MKQLLQTLTTVFLFVLYSASPAQMGMGGGQAMSGLTPPAVARNPIIVDPREYLDKVVLPEGFSIAIYAENMPGARSLTISPEGVVFAGARRDAKNNNVEHVYAVVDTNHDMQADQVYHIGKDLNMPNGVAYRDGSLYVAEISRILRYDDILDRLDNPPEPVVVNDSFPTDAHHGWKFIRFGPDNRLYVPVGAPCNTCLPSDEHARIFSIRADGSDKQTYAYGIRHTVGFDWHPVTAEMWFTDNGRDIWGDDRPPEELNHAPRQGMHFGFPYRYGKDLVDDDYATDLQDKDFTGATIELPAHNAAIGMRFYTGEQFPEEYQNQAFIASHGSWNRSVPDGYKVFVTEIDTHSKGYGIFADGWLVDNQYWGRPVDVELMSDGSVLVSDDHNGLIYRISYQK